MKNLINFSWSKLPFLLLSLGILNSCKTTTEVDTFPPELLISWNDKIMEMAIEEDGLLSLKGVRTEAMMHVAIHDALHAIRPVFAAYSFKGTSPTADPLAAAGQAAYEIAVSQFPDHQETLAAERDSWLATVSEPKAKTAGIALGTQAAQHILTARMGDSWNGEADYSWHPMAPGVYAEFNEHSGTPEGFIFGAGWATARPFLLTSQDQFRSPPPPEITSEAYAAAFREVKEYGSHESALRTEDQAHFAMWWKDFVENSHNRLARELVVKEQLNLWEAARVFALLNMTIYDAYVNVFDNKFYYNHWRPYTAIRWAAHDENPNTAPDPEWNNLHQHTYAFPSYPSAHGTASTAAMTVLAHTLGTGDQYSFTMTTEEVDQAGPFSGKVKMDPPSRTFTHFSQAGLEASLSRIYLGIHFRYDSEEGHKLGAMIGNYANQHYLNPLPSPQ